MTDACAISAQLVDIRNVGTHKVVKLTLHAPEEYAMKIMEAFGWPTMVAPVPVALARLSVPQRQQTEAAETTPAGSSPSARPAGVEKSKSAFNDLPEPQQAGILCNERAFWTFLRERDPKMWLRCHYAGNQQLEYPDTAAAVVRELCKVNSRAEITPKNVEWTTLRLSYRAWQKAAEVVPA